MSGTHIPMVSFQYVMNINLINAIGAHKFHSPAAPKQIYRTFECFGHNQWGASRNKTEIVFGSGFFLVWFKGSFPSLPSPEPQL